MIKDVSNNKRNTKVKELKTRESEREHFFFSFEGYPSPQKMAIKPFPFLTSFQTGAINNGRQS